MFVVGACLTALVTVLPLISVVREKYSIPKEFDYMGTSGMWQIRDKAGILYGAAAYTVYIKGFYDTVTEWDLLNELLEHYGLKTGEIICVMLDRKTSGDFNGTGCIKFRNSIIARLTIWELGETNDPLNSGWPMKCGLSECRVYAMPCNREMLLPMYPWCRLTSQMHGLTFCGQRWLPSGERTMWHPRMYSEANGVIVCDEFSDQLINWRPKMHG